VLSVGAGCAHAAASPTAAQEPPAFTVRVSGAGQPVVFIPDLGAPGEVWDTTLAHLGGRVEAHVIDIAGFAGTPPTPGPLLPKLRDQLAAYLRERKLVKPILVGHMYGATVAFLVAMSEPDLVGGVIAIDSPPSRGQGDKDDDAEAAEGRKGLSEAPPEKFAMMVSRRLASMMADKELAKHLAERVVKSSQSVYAETFYDMMTRDLRAEIPKIRAPVLIFLTQGNLPQEAWPIVQKLYEAQLSVIPKHELVVVPNSKHYVMFDAPEAFFGPLDRFLAAAGH
jgi:pimeloyl-ACP methyl ester carboxylesterase